MKGWSTHQGLATVLALENVDTDQLIPARFMTTPRSEGYGQYLLHDQRHGHDGTPLSDHPLNEAPDASILVARRNFGSGSSREAAVYALVDAGFKAVIAPSFGDIFSNNAINNGLLPAIVPESAVARLIDVLATPSELSINLDRKTISGGGFEIGFELDPVRQQKLIMGWDDIDLTLSETETIAGYQANRRRTSPWAWPNTRT